MSLQYRRSAGAILVAGTIVGTLVGGSSTVGILSVFIGDYMRSDFPDMSAGQAFSRFLAEQLPRGLFLPSARRGREQQKMPPIRQDLS